MFRVDFVIEKNNYYIMIEEDGLGHIKNSPCKLNRMFIISYMLNKKCIFLHINIKENLTNGDDEILERVDTLYQHINDVCNIENIDDYFNDLYDDTKQLYHAIYLYY